MKHSFSHAGDPSILEDFQHEPLDLEQDTFRLLDIDGVSSRGLVECTIRLRNRDDISCSYNALSYAWGSEEQPGWIILNRRRFRVRKNLLQFLQSTTSHAKARRNLWIDAICIDQGNVSEKNHQVNQMADIYRNATTVFVWLGLSLKEKTGIFGSGRYKRLHALLKNVEECCSLEDRQEMRLLDIHYGLFCNDPHPVSRLVVDILTREYWERMWIVQEIIFGEENVLLLCGEHKFPLSAFQKL
ncbi:uncharacterized protein K452DRAFT_232719, partial [Aplosporella prunicola CBS 121167]